MRSSECKKNGRSARKENRKVKILAKMGKKEQGRCQKESVVLKNGQSTDNGKHVTVRVQRIRKIHIKQKLIIFSVLAVCLVVLAVFSDHLCPYDPYAQDLSSALQAPSLQHPMGTDTYGRDMLSRVISGARASIFSTFILVAVISILVRLWDYAVAIMAEFWILL